MAIEYVTLTLGEWNDFRKGYKVTAQTGFERGWLAPLYFTDMSGEQPRLEGKTIKVDKLILAPIVSACCAFDIVEDSHA